jgi:acyl carrier protein
MTAVRVLLASTEHGPARAEERAASRRALRLLTTALGQDGTSTSLSHAEGISVAAAVIASPSSIGVDLEENRTADPRTGRFFLRDHELAWLAAASPRNDEHMRLWTVKEALFKADPGNAGTVLRSYALADPGARAGYARRGPGVRFGYGSARLGERHLSVAVCLTGSPITEAPEAHRGVPGGRPPGLTTERSAMTSTTLTAEAVLERIAGLLTIPVAEVTPQTPIRNLVRESFMLVELVIDLQEEYGVYFTQGELREIETIGQLIDLLQASPRS